MVVDPSLDYGAGWFRVREALFDELAASPRYHATLIVSLALERRARRSHAGPRASRSGGIVDAQVGQAVFGERELADSLGLDRKRVRTAIRNLERRGVIVCEHRKEGTIATLVGYPEPSERSRPSKRNPFGYAPPRTDHPVSDEPVPFGEMLVDAPRRGPRSSPAIQSGPHENLGHASDEGAHVQAHDGPGSGPRRAPNESTDQGEPSFLGSGSSDPEPPLGGGGDHVQAWLGAEHRLVPTKGEPVAAVGDAWERSQRIASGGRS